MPVILYTYLLVRDDPKEASPLQDPWPSFHDNKITEGFAVVALLVNLNVEQVPGPWES
jgi:hypothetical protein